MLQCARDRDRNLHRKPIGSGAVAAIPAARLAHDRVTEDPRCPELSSTIIGNGTATHLGQFTVHMQDCFSPAGPPFIFQNGVLTLTAPDGSTITGTYQGQLVLLPTSSQDGTFGIVGTYTFTGGTGRSRTSPAAETL
jgi:hypothetical protein